MMNENAHVIPGTSLGESHVCLLGHCVCCLGSMIGSVHLHMEISHSNAKIGGKSASVIGL